MLRPSPFRISGKAPRLRSQLDDGPEYSGKRNLGFYAGAVPGRTDDVETAVEGLDAGGQSVQAGAVVGVGATHAVVADGHRCAGVRADHANRCVRRSRVLAHIGDRLGDDVVGRRLDAWGQTLLRHLGDLDRDGRAREQGVKRRSQATLREDGRVDPSRQFAELREPLGEIRGVRTIVSPAVT